MRKYIFILLGLGFLNIGNSFAASVSDYNAGANAYRNMYSQYNTVDSISGSSSQNVRNVVSRSATAGNGTARAAKPSGSARRVVARSGTNSTTTAARSATGTTGTASRSSDRKVVSRSVISRSSRGDSSYTNDLASSGNSNNSTDTAVSATRCLSDYLSCMDEYCERDSMEYNRCYCSARLAQIDSKYQDKIQELVEQIIALQYEGTYTDTEMQEYWEDKIVKYTGSNSWIKLDEALNIDWSNTESRVQGQETFVVGHEYCSQHLKACGYMATNMRDVYLSKIATDCDTYEKSLDAVKTVAESVIENYSDE